MQMTKQRKTGKNQFCHKIKSHDATFTIMPCQVRNEMAQTCWMFLNFLNAKHNSIYEKLLFSFSYTIILWIWYKLKWMKENQIATFETNKFERLPKAYIFIHISFFFFNFLCIFMSQHYRFLFACSTFFHSYVFIFFHVFLPFFQVEWPA